MSVEEIKPDVWRVNGKIIHTSKASIKAIEDAARKYANALKRLAER